MQEELTKLINENKKLVLNKVLINKLDSIAYDIKYYMNTNVNLSQSHHINFMDREDIDELTLIRKKLKILTHKLKNKL